MPELAVQRATELGHKVECDPPAALDYRANVYGRAIYERCPSGEDDRDRP
ncbi:hypothetical protein GCM10012275_54950 [Longimycelium tulufanense]|uniref:Uncharacterized protein n=1 Tax=Longimycelium tulufanense TaxID=907463 RepID=A0A8J3CDB1_9PSEU|nr:hypothetical protein [Longimycelium tulufanense]GGM77290.1 hypothetical protein GCM10012275_54950 [Longimycelium tulufanense]